MFKTLEELVYLDSIAIRAGPGEHENQYWISTEDNGYNPNRYVPIFHHNIYFLVDIYSNSYATKFYYVEFFREEAFARIASRMIYNKKYFSF